MEEALLFGLLLVYLSRHWFGGAWGIVSMTLILFCPILFLKFKGRPIRDLWLCKENLGGSVQLGLLTGLILIPLEVASLYVSLGHFVVMPGLTWWLPLAMLAGQLTTIALPEEVLFRGFLQRWLAERLPIGVAVVAQAIICVLLHPRYYLLGYYYISLIVLVAGLLFGLVTWKTRNLGGAILCHALGNTLCAILFYTPPVVVHK